MEYKLHSPTMMVDSKSKTDCHTDADNADTYSDVYSQGSYAITVAFP